VEQIQKVTIKALVVKENKVLFVKDNHNLWELPGGTMKQGETEEETLRRELGEELNIDEANIGKLISSGSFIVLKPEWDKKYAYTAKIYEAEFNIQNAKLSDEHVEMKWFSSEEISNINTREIYRNASKIVFDQLSSNT